ncbi:hypothetical protein GCM10011490_01650 [Pseudoclavibacter endophyticus]|nr:hypothetical protein GCM10011490_01650 [Pseudoclavibacter endophyticus]
MIPVHAIAASLVVLLAPVNLVRRRRDRAHRVIGRTWVLAMYVTCVSGMFIYSLTGGFTAFHALAIFTFLTTTLGVVNIRRGHRRAHVGNMVGGWLGALVAGGFAAFVPARDIPMWAIGTPFLFWSIVAGIVVGATAWVWFVLAYAGRGQVGGARGLAAGSEGGGTGPAPAEDVHRKVIETL